jgi:hypothetical protein
MARMDHHVTTEGTQHIIIDYLWFIQLKASAQSYPDAHKVSSAVSTTSAADAKDSPGYGSGAKKAEKDYFALYMAQDKIIDKLRAYATEKNVSRRLLLTFAVMGVYELCRNWGCGM